MGLTKVIFCSCDYVLCAKSPWLEDSEEPYGFQVDLSGRLIFLQFSKWSSSCGVVLVYFEWTIFELKLKVLRV